MASAAEDDPFWDLRVLALEALGKFGGDAMPAIAVVKRASSHKEPEIRAAARYAKKAIQGSRALKEWVELLDSTNDWQRKCAFSALQYWGARSAPAVPKLTRLAEWPSRWQMDAIRTLGAIGHRASPAVPQLVSLLSSPEPKIRALAAEALGKIYEGTDEVLAALRKAALDKNPMVQEQARKALLEFAEPPAGQKGSSSKRLGEPHHAVSHPSDEAER